MTNRTRIILPFSAGISKTCIIFLIKMLYDLIVNPCSRTDIHQIAFKVDRHSPVVRQAKDNLIA